MSDVKQQARDRSRELFRQGIVEAAQRVFERNGFAGTRMTDIAGEAGLATGTLYNYFDSKEAILAEMMNATGSAFLRALSESIEQHDSPIGKISAFLRGAFSFATEQAPLYRVFHEVGPRTDASAELVQHKQSLEQQFHELLLAIVQEGHQAGELRSELDPELLAWTLGASLHGLLDVVLADPESELDPSVAFAVLEKVLLKGITQ